MLYYTLLIHCRFDGTMRWEHPNKLHFAFRNLNIRLGPWQLQDKGWEPTSEKTYEFKYVDETVSALRSSAGGLILMRKEGLKVQ